MSLFASGINKTWSLPFNLFLAGVEYTSSVSHEEFVSTNAGFAHDPTIVLWNNIFLALVVVTHEVVTAVVCTPNSMHFLFMMVLVFYTSFSVILQPKLQTPSDVSGASSSVASTYLVAVAFYGIGMVYVCSNISFDPHQWKVQLITAFIFVDLLLILGHVWDPVPLMATIMNCRFIYLVCMIFLNAAIYLTWDRLLKIPYIH
jgi:hypothetical protein